MKNQEFQVRETLEHTVDHWWILVALTIAGGMIGWLFHYLQSPIYDSASILTITMEFPKNRGLTQYEEDYAFNSAEYIINSMQVKSMVIEQAKSDGIMVDYSTLQQEFSLERRQSNWTLNVRDRSPQRAATLANLWAEKSLVVLNNALGHAVRVDALEDQITGLANGLAATPPSVTYDQFQVTLKNYISQILQEKTYSAGILSNMTFDQSEAATAPGGPTLYKPGLLVLAGGAIGFIISLWAAALWDSRRHG